MLYLDNSATTKVDPEVVKEMMPYLQEEYGNPSSKYYPLAVNAKTAVKIARRRLAILLDCDEDEIIFTSGATESNNMVLKGVADLNTSKKHIITSKVEHPSVLEVCKYLENKGFHITYLDVDQFGRINTSQLEEKIIQSPPSLVSIIWGNNETGSLNNIEEIARICSEHNVYFHTDATQVLGKFDINLKKLTGIRFLSLSAHKVFGPKGVGACFIRKENNSLKTKITPLLHGGSQENGYRSGTLAVHNIVGLGKAAELAGQRREENSKKLNQLELFLKNILIESFKDQVEFYSDTIDKIPGILSVRFKDITHNEIMIKKLSPYIALSAGSACSSGKPSHVLRAMGKSLEQIQQTVRISLSPSITREDLEIFKKLT